MSWALVATAAAGLNAGAGLSASLVERASVEQPLVLDAYRAMLKATSANKIALSNTLATLSAGAALSAYFAGGDNPDPAWITCALVTGVLPSPGNFSSHPGAPLHPFFPQRTAQKNTSSLSASTDTLPPSVELLLLPICLPSRRYSAVQPTGAVSRSQRGA